jgi:hypothetical protein
LETTFGQLEYVAKHNVSLFQEAAMHTTGLPNGNVRAWGVGVWHLIVTNTFNFVIGQKTFNFVIGQKIKRNSYEQQTASIGF